MKYGLFGDKLPETGVSKEELANLLKALSEPESPGAWIVYDIDGNAYPLALFDNELDALRWCQQAGYGQVKFWAFGTDWR